MSNSFAGNVLDITSLTSLKRDIEHVENVVKEEVGGLRHEVKRIRHHSEIMWFSAPGMLSNPSSLLSLPANVI